MTSRERLLLAVPAGTALLGGVVAALWHPSRRACSLMLHFAAAVVLVTEELLREAHKGGEPETPISTLALFAGFLAFWAVQLAGPA